MNEITIQNVEGRITLSFEKSNIPDELILDFLEKIRIEYLIIKGNIQKDILSISNELKQDWWKKNKDHFLM